MGGAKGLAFPEKVVKLANELNNEARRAEGSASASSSSSSAAAHRESPAALEELLKDMSEEIQQKAQKWCKENGIYSMKILKDGKAEEVLIKAALALTENALRTRLGLPVTSCMGSV